MTDIILEQQTVQLEDLKYFWTSSGLPCFYADRTDIEDIVEGLGFKIYYLICNVAEDKPTTTTTIIGSSTAKVTAPSQTIQTNFTTQIVKVVNNIIGRSISVVNDDISDLASVRESASYTMPPIPKVIVDKLDQFFRLVDAQHGTESIVLLTFDPSKEDSSSWGILVPEQTNTAVHCNYNPDSVVEEKPENILIVGSVHSHPGMAAYASGTDHSDQADFDGLHITYGWQKNVNNGSTQYHIEMQMSGSSWTLQPGDVFQDFEINKEPDPDVVEWSNKVKKVHPPLHTQAGVTNTVFPQTAQSPVTHPITDITEVGTLKQYKPKINSDKEYIIAAEINPSAKDIICPNCHTPLRSYEISTGYCDVCDIPLVNENDSIDQIFEHLRWYLQCRFVKTDVVAYIWTTNSDSTSEFLMNVGTIRFKNSLEVEFVKDYSSPVMVTKNDKDQITLSNNSSGSHIHYWDCVEEQSAELSEFDRDLTVCCSTKIDLNDCQCPIPVFVNDIDSFELAHSNEDIYNEHSKCFECRWFSGPNCADYVEAVVNFATSGLKLISPITECNHFEPYKSLDDYLKQKMENYYE